MRGNSARSTTSTARRRTCAAELEKLGGAKVILSTVTSGKAVNAVLGGIAINGKLILAGNPDQPIEVAGRLLIGGRRSISGWPSGRPIDSQDTLSFCVLTGVRPMIEVYPLERAAEAYERMMSGKRAVSRGADDRALGGALLRYRLSFAPGGFMLGFGIAATVASCGLALLKSERTKPSPRRASATRRRPGAGARPGASERSRLCQSHSVQPGRARRVRPRQRAAR